MPQIVLQRALKRSRTPSLAEDLPCARCASLGRSVRVCGLSAGWLRQGVHRHGAAGDRDGPAHHDDGAWPGGGTPGDSECSHQCLAGAGRQAPAGAGAAVLADAPRHLCRVRARGQLSCQRLLRPRDHGARHHACLYALFSLLSLPLRVPQEAEWWLAPLIGALTGLLSVLTGVFLIPLMPYLNALSL